MWESVICRSFSFGDGVDGSDGGGGGGKRAAIADSVWELNAIKFLFSLFLETHKSWFRVYQYIRVGSKWVWRNWER